MEVPVVTKEEYLLVNIENNYTSLMDTKNNTRDDLKLPEDEVEF